jgi:hypothetical protein
MAEELGHNEEIFCVILFPKNSQEFGLIFRGLDLMGQIEISGLHDWKYPYSHSNE